MALIARVSGDSGELCDWLEDPADIEPVTSRSPSFVRIKVEGSAELPEEASSPSFATHHRDHARHASIEECVTESSPPPAWPAPRAIVPPRLEPLPLPTDDASLVARCAERAIELEVRTMQLEDTARQIVDARLRDAVRCLLEDVADVDDALRAKGLPHALVHHVYEWASNVVAQADERLSPARAFDGVESDAPSAVSIGLSVAEYSSLFVRAILEPMLNEATAQRRGATDARGAEDLRALEERVMWLNWTLKRIAPVDA
jgi:hypothetical protein